MTVSDNAIQAEVQSEFLRNLAKKGRNVTKKKAKNVIGNTGRGNTALENGVNVGSTFTTRNSETDLSSLPEMVKF